MASKWMMAGKKKNKIKEEKELNRHENERKSVAKSQLFRLSVGLIELFSAEAWKQSIKNNLQSACCQLQLTANIRLSDNSR